MLLAMAKRSPRVAPSATDVLATMMLRLLNILGHHLCQILHTYTPRTPASTTRAHPLHIRLPVLLTSHYHTSNGQAQAQVL